MLVPLNREEFRERSEPLRWSLFKESSERNKKKNIFFHLFFCEGSIPRWAFSCTYSTLRGSLGELREQHNFYANFFPRNVRILHTQQPRDDEFFKMHFAYSVGFWHEGENMKRCISPLLTIITFIVNKTAKEYVQCYYLFHYARLCFGVYPQDRWDNEMAYLNSEYLYCSYLYGCIK